MKLGRGCEQESERQQASHPGGGSDQMQKIGGRMNGGRRARAADAMSCPGERAREAATGNDDC
jgi:hypothetical protein